MTVTQPPLLADSPDITRELDRLREQVAEIERLTQRSFEERGETVPLAWLRRITHQVDRLQMSWYEALPPATRPATIPWRRRRSDADEALTPRE